ncbi:hypothetical protein FL583_35270 [Cryptosporangium phraense]|uniref:Uncharacterized protein n=1 Tax=Cryptosporangium phraense TaxID=2593070 RepID=A0A545AGH4_9ACTN|nr:hypothetical protein FL583_35270 [Cryptosporangium phraense]
MERPGANLLRAFWRAGGVSCSSCSPSSRCGDGACGGDGAGGSRSRTSSCRCSSRTSCRSSRSCRPASGEFRGEGVSPSWNQIRAERRTVRSAA